MEVSQPYPFLTYEHERCAAYLAVWGLRCAVNADPAAFKIRHDELRAHVSLSFQCMT